jgi:hypothetical protein
VSPRFPGILRQRAPGWDEYDDALDLDEFTREQSHCSPCGESFDGSPELCPSCGGDTLITTWGDAQADRFLSGDRYATAAGRADVDGWAPLARYIGRTVWP